MLTAHEALATILSESKSYGDEKVPLRACIERFLAEDVATDRDSPPFDRVTMDGIAIRLGTIDNLLPTAYIIQGMQAAGMPQETLKDAAYCLEVMTGAILPCNTDTVIPYEAIRIENNRAFPQNNAIKKRNIHYQGQDARKGTTILPKGKKITAADVGILATVGKEWVKVAKVPKVAVIATGNELVEINEKPQKHQIRKSNVYALEAALLQDGIEPTTYHLTDDWYELTQKLPTIIDSYDVLLFSGGVSKGKYDFVPAALLALGVEKHFHNVAQRPGKPFWFGKHPCTETLVFAFPGNPLSTFIGYHYYFRQWLYCSMGNPLQFPLKSLPKPVPSSKDLSLFIPVMLVPNTDEAMPLPNNGSGDLFSLAKAHGFILLSENSGDHKLNGAFPFIGFA